MCIGALLREGTAGASRYGYSMLRRIVEHIRKHWPEVRVKVRGDCGFGNPKMYALCDKYGLEYIFGLSTNNVLSENVQGLWNEVEDAYKESGEEKKLFKAFSYKAGSWDRERTVICKMEHTGIGMNRRFIVISDCVRELSGEEAGDIYNNFVQRGSVEVNIGDWKNALNADRMSCCKFVANWFRLILHTIAYNIMVLVKRMCKDKVTEIYNGSLNTMRLYLVKIGTMVRRLKTKIKVHLSSSFPYIEIFFKVLKLAT